MDTDDHLHPDSPLMTMSRSFLNDGILALSMPGPARDPNYYIPDGNSVLLVENTLFRVSAKASVLHISRGRAHVQSFILTLCDYVGPSVYAHKGQVCIRDYVPIIFRN